MMNKTAPSILQCLMISIALIGCGSGESVEEASSTEVAHLTQSSPVEEPSGSTHEANQSPEEKPTEKDEEDVSEVRVDWIIKRETDQSGNEIGPIQIESTRSFESEGGKRIMFIETRISGEVVFRFKLNRADGGVPYTKPSSSSENRIRVKVSDGNGKVETSSGRLIDPWRALIKPTEKANLLLKRSLANEDNVSVEVLWGNDAYVLGVFKNINLKGYRQKTEELRTLIQNR